MIRLAGQAPALTFRTAKELRRIHAEGQVARLEDEARAARKRLDDLIEKLIAIADEFDGEADAEESGDLEPYTGVSSAFYGDDLEDEESSLPAA